MLNIGFTGPRDGMSAHQAQGLGELLRLLSGGKPFVFRHGDCIGSDEQAHEVARSLGAYVIVHPAFPLGHPMRAGCECDVALPIKPPLARNDDIVEAIHELVATPNGPEVLRSGTWSTIRKARRANKPVHLIPPPQENANG